MASATWAGPATALAAASLAPTWTTATQSPGLTDTVDCGSAKNGDITLAGTLTANTQYRFTVQTTAVATASRINVFLKDGGLTSSGAFVPASYTNVVNGTSFDVILTNINSAATSNIPHVIFMIY